MPLLLGQLVVKTNTESTSGYLRKKEMSCLHSPFVLLNQRAITQTMFEPQKRHCPWWQLSGCFMPQTVTKWYDQNLLINVGTHCHPPTFCICYTIIILLQC